MADPVTLATVGIGASAAAGGIGAFGSIMGGEAQKKMYDYKAGVAKANEQIAKQNADYSRHVGEVEAQRSGMMTAFKIASQKSVQAGSGIDVNKGSAAALRQSEHEVGTFDEATIRANAARKAYGYEIAAMGASAEGKLATMAGETAETAGYIGAAGSIIGSAGSVSSKWMEAQRYGVFS